MTGARLPADMDPAHGELRIPFPDAAAAKRAAQCLEPDNDGHLESRIEGAALVLVARGSTMGLLRTFDDALGCLRATGVE